MTQNANRTGYTRLITVHGDTLHLSEWARRAGMSVQALDRRLRAGWTAERAISEPLHK
jgi:hypothetical protein